MTVASLGEPMRGRPAQRPPAAAAVVLVVLPAGLARRLRRRHRTGHQAGPKRYLLQALTQALALAAEAPVSMPAPRRRPRPAGVRRRPGPGGAVVLLAEDNTINQKVAVRMLDKLGYRADAVATVTRRSRRSGRRPYDVVLMDCQMPEMDGYQATAVIRRSRGGTRRHTVVMP